MNADQAETSFEHGVLTLRLPKSESAKPKRIAVGLLFIGHGTQKLFGWFGGHGVSATAGWLVHVG